MSMTEEGKKKPKILVFASGTKTGGGSGFEKLVQKQRENILDAEIVAVVSNWENGGVKQRAETLGIPFVYMSSPYTEENYKEIMEKFNPNLVCLSGWLKLVPIKSKGSEKFGFDPKCIINIHPGPIPRFGGNGMYGKYVHEAVYEAFKKGEVFETGPTIHFVTEKFDEGPVIFYKSFKIEENDNPESIAKKVQNIEHEYQAYVTNLVAHGFISWDGQNPNSLKLPTNYPFL